jgi:hypothetical protein
VTPEIAQLLRQPFPPEKIGKLPRVTCGDCRDARSRVCDKHTKSRCGECASWITGAHIHLDFVGHADTTDRLLEADPEWTWEPFALDPRGLPALDDNGGMWIRLTVSGVTRIGYGDADGKRGGAAMKETIGDCLITGTPILTRDGWQPVETVAVGQEVPTRHGWRRVTDHWLSAESAPVLAVLVDDGRVLVATPHHRVPTQRGAVSVRALRNGDMLYAWPDTARQPTQKTWSGLGASTAATPTIRTGTGGFTSWPPQNLGRSCTGISISRSMVPSPMAGTSTIATTILSTTPRPTSSRSPLLSTPSITTRNESRCPTAARIAVATSPPTSAHATSGGAAPDARKRLGGPQGLSSLAPVLPSRPSTGPAPNVVSPSQPLSRGPSSVAPRVVAVLDAGVAPVWNLSVDEVHEYVANGLFVHNSIRNASMRFGVALDLWRKETHVDESTAPRPRPQEPAPVPPNRQNILTRAAVKIRDATSKDDCDRIGQRITEHEKAQRITAQDAIDLRRQLVARQEELSPTSAVMPVTERQHKRMHVLWPQVGLGGTENREMRLTRTSLIVGRDIDSSAHLTAAEADRVIDALEAERKASKEEAK